MKGAPALSSPSTRPGLPRVGQEDASDYLRAIRRRIAAGPWPVAIPIATAGTLYVLRMPATYLVTARIEIKAPKIDSHIAMIVTEGELSRADATDEKYIPDTLAMLNDKGLAKETLRDQALGLPPPALEGDPAGRAGLQDQDPADPPVAPLRRHPRRHRPRPDHSDAQPAPEQVPRSGPTARVATPTKRPSRTPRPWRESSPGSWTSSSSTSPRWSRRAPTSRRAAGA